MRLLTFDRNGTPTIGIRLGDEVVDLSRAAPYLPKDMVSLLAGGQDALDVAKSAAEKARGDARLPLATIKHLLPIARPDKNIGLGLNYLKHIREMDPNFQTPPFPGMFFRVPDSMVAHKEAIVRPAISDTLDWEGELLVVIGKTGHMLSREDALSIVAGYSCHNDGSLREYNAFQPALSAGKNFNRTGGFGPEIVTADELPPGGKGLKLQTHVNGKLMQDDTTDHMHWDVAHLIHLMSRIMILYPGDIIATGTPGGVGAGFKPPIWLKEGDVVDVTIEGIGTLSNPVEDAPERKTGEWPRK